MRDTAGMKFDCILEEPLDFIDIDYTHLNKTVRYEARPQGECNKCRYYEGVHGVNGHAPCSFWGIGGVLASDYCSRFEKVVTESD